MWRKRTPRDCRTTTWSGGTTTELAIQPEGAIYQERTFLWRVSSAQVEESQTQFTSLPDYHRLLSPLEGTLTLQIQGERAVQLSPYETWAFDGGAAVESHGCCTDFNLMVRKGYGVGWLQWLLGEERGSWTIPLATGAGAMIDVVLFCHRGALYLPQEGIELASGELLLGSELGERSIPVEWRDRTAAAIAVIQGEDRGQIERPDPLEGETWGRGGPEK